MVFVSLIAFLFFMLMLPRCVSASLIYIYPSIVLLLFVLQRSLDCARPIHPSPPSPDSFILIYQPQQNTHPRPISPCFIQLVSVLSLDVVTSATVYSRLSDILCISKHFSSFTHQLAVPIFYLDILLTFVSHCLSPLVLFPFYSSCNRLS